MFVDLELWLHGAWHLAGRLEASGDPSRGYLGRVSLEYDYDHAMEHLGEGGSRALSCRYLPSFELWVEEPWPAFVFDVLPAGAARRSMLARLGRPDDRAADWELLARAHHPPGNLRVRPASETAASQHPGFDRAEVIERGPDFVEYAFERGAPVAGSTGAQGDSPKFLLLEDRAGRWHAEGAVGEERIARHWLVKFPRGRHASDLTILAEEARYMELARRAGLRANQPLEHQDGCLFIPRFDRVEGAYLGLETIASLSGIAAYGVPQSKQDSARAVAAYCTEPATELRELLLRDVLDLALGNTDNHVRNTSVLKHPDGRVELSPLYDLAPMILDRSGIPRTGRWGEREAPGGPIDWAGVIDDLVELGADLDSLREGLAAMADYVAALGEHMGELGVSTALARRLERRQASLARDLSRVAGS